MATSQVLPKIDKIDNILEKKIDTFMAIFLIFPLKINYLFFDQYSLIVTVIISDKGNAKAYC